jgi:dTDP-4-amino-4,6-dideoxygalactose transaminase
VSRLPALCGGTPLFGDRPLGTAQLATPDHQKLFKRLRQLSIAQTSDSQANELEEKLAEFHQVAEVITVANASYGLLLALALAIECREGAIFMPSYSYRGLPYFARILKRKPVFIDISDPGGTMDPEALSHALQKEPAAVVLAVHNADWPCTTAALEAVCQTFKTPLLIDAVFSLGNTEAGQLTGGGGLAEIFSLHATKLLNGFEGGYITTNNKDFAQSLRVLRANQRQGNLAPFPCPLNELHAATALVSLEGLEATIERNRVRWEAYFKVLKGASFLKLWEGKAGTRRHWCSCLLEVLPESPLSRDQLLKALAAEGILARSYYGPALHQLKPWSESNAEYPLSCTERLAPKVLQLPVGDRVQLPDIERIVEAIVDFQKLGPEALFSSKGQA